MSLDKLKKLAKDKKIQFIDIKFTDLPGVWHHITLPISSLEAKLFTNGVGVDGSSLPGFSAIEKGDMILIPDTSTAIQGKPCCARFRIARENRYTSTSLTVPVTCNTGVRPEW